MEKRKHQIVNIDIVINIGEESKNLTIFFFHFLSCFFSINDFALNYLVFDLIY